jgi:hypothetical protein
MLPEHDDDDDVIHTTLAMQNVFENVIPYVNSSERDG